LRLIKVEDDDDSNCGRVEILELGVTTGVDDILLLAVGTILVIDIDSDRSMGTFLPNRQRINQQDEPDKPINGPINNELYFDNLIYKSVLCFRPNELWKINIYTP
jgi:hypothetical protein